jgi:hypothetical protein
MRMRVQGRSIRFIDELSKREEAQADLGDPQKPREPVRDDFGPHNPYPATYAEICQWSPEQHRQWMETGRKPLHDEQAVISGEGRPATNAVVPNEPSTERQTTGMSAEIRESFARSGTYSPGVADVAANEHFARISDRRHGYRSAATADETKGLSPAERFAAASAAKWASYDPHGRVLDLRRRRSED